MKKEFVLIDNAPREYLYEDLQIYNLSGRFRREKKIGLTPNYRNGEIGLIHPKIFSFFKSYDTSSQDFWNQRFAVVNGIKESLHPGFKFDFSGDNVPVLVCNLSESPKLFPHSKTNQFNFSYSVIPFRENEFKRVQGRNLGSILSMENSSPNNDLELRKKVAILNSFDMYLDNEVISLKDIPVETSYRVGSLPRKNLNQDSDVLFSL